MWKTLDVISSTVHREGVGSNKKHVVVIEFDHEQVFWDKGLLGYSSPRKLQKKVFFYTGLYYTLRGVEEQHSLAPEQFIRYPPESSVYNSDVYYEDTEFISKNNQHCYKDINTNKVVRTYAQIGSDRCIVRLLDFYLAKLKLHSPFFYTRPLEQIPDDGKPWYTSQRVGINTLKGKLNSESGIDVRYTNHSSRATSATRMFSRVVPEKVIAKKTGHLSLQSLRSYEKTQCSMEKALDSVIANPALDSFSGVERLNKTLGDT